MATTIHPGPVGYYLRHYILSALLGLLALAGAIILASNLPSIYLAALAVAGLLVLLLPAVHAYLHSRETSLTLDGMEVTYQTGIISRKIITVAVGQITDSSLSQDLLDKILGSATFEINTSGSTGYEIDEGGFSFVQAKTMRDAIYALIDKSPPAPKK